MKEADFNVKNKITLRVLCTYSMLPGKSFLSKDASIFIDEDLCFLATRTQEKDEYYELAWCAPEEISLIGSVVVGMHPEYGKAFFYPARWPYYLEDDEQDLSCDDQMKDIYEHLKKKIEVRHLSEKDLNAWEELPAFLKDSPYSFNHQVKLSSTYQQYLLGQIKQDDHLMIRGLSHLLKCGMLRCLSRSFIDTACLEIYIALEATLQIILTRLQSAGNSNPSNKDASDYLLKSFGEPYCLDRYYQDYYDDRIKAIHPSSRFGIAMFTPLYVDDLYMLYNDLLRNYEFLITGTPNCYLKYQAD